MTARSGSVACELCEQNGGDEPLFDGRLRRCGSCGFMWTARETDTPATELYDEDYFRGRCFRDYFNEQAQRRYEARKRLWWLLSRTRPASLLEAGPAAGFFLDEARRAGIRVRGVEPAEVCVRFAAEQLNLPVRQGLFEEAPPPDTSVQAVCAFHVLEHVDDPHAFLSAARRALVPGGWLALEVPNIASDAARRAGASWHALQPEFHRWHFTPRTLQNLVRQHGFEPCYHDTVAVGYYLRPRGWLTPRGGWLLFTEWRANGNFLRPHPQRLDIMRLLARLPESVL